MLSLRFSLSAVLAFLVAQLGPETAAAQDLCRLAGVARPGLFQLQCTDAFCMTDEECEDLPGLEASCAESLLRCRPRCGTLLSCSSDEDCLAAEGTCVSVAAPDGALAGRSFCETNDIFCRPVSAMSVTAEAFVACFTLPRSDSIAPSWFDGDCDRDGCPNANDEAPCEAGLRDCRFSPTAALECDARSAGTEGPEACVLSGTEVSCGTAHECDTDGDCPTGFECAASGCKPSSCTTFYACRSPEDCPDEELGLGTAVCVPAPEIFSSAAPRDGFCAFSSFRADASCLGMVEACATRPDGAFTLDLFEGDCDDDGCPNGIDPSVCEHGFDTCDAGESLACGTPLVGPGMDAGLPDGGTSMTDAGALDGGGFDAGGLDGAVAPRVTFGGGGGCVCRAASATSTGGAAGARALLTSLAIVALVTLRRRA